MKNIAKLTSYGCYLDCDFVTAKYPGDETHIVGNVAEYVYDLEQKISDLEAKLAESEKELLQKEKKIEDLMLCEFVATSLDFNKLSADNCRLREQLADIEANKEKEINRICKTHIEANAQLKQQLAEKELKAKETLNRIFKDNRETKISFAVEQLEKVKELLYPELRFDYSLYLRVMHEIDNQIEAIKEMK